MKERQEVTLLLEAAAGGHRQALRDLLPRVYDELRQLATAQMAREKPGQTLQPTALVHEAFLRLVGTPANAAKFADRRYFFAAAAEAMRRILIDHARRKRASKHGGDWQRLNLEDFDPAVSDEDGDLEALAAALDELVKVDPQAAELVNLRWFAGRSMAEIAELLNLSVRTAERHWAFARAWLYQKLGQGG